MYIYILCTCIYLHTYGLTCFLFLLFLQFGHPIVPMEAVGIAVVFFAIALQVRHIAVCIAVCIYISIYMYVFFYLSS